MYFSSPPSLATTVRRWRIALLLPAIVFSGSVFGAEEKEKGPPPLNEKTTELFGKIAPFQKEQNWKAILDLINAALPTLPADSYDLAEVLSSKGIALLQIEDYSHALEPLENALKISDAHGFFEQGKTLQILDIVARLNAQEGQAAKTPAAQEPFYAKSVAYLKRELKESPKPKIETRLLYAQILVQYATINPEKINAALIKEAKGEVENVLQSSVKPTESMYALLQFALQQEGNLEKSTQVLELMVNQFPNKSGYWQALMTTYVTLAQNNEKNPDKFRQFYTRAINTIERAQPYGFLKAPKDQFNLVTMYTIVGQFGRSTELLHAGLRNATIESDVKNWLQLAYAYQQAHLELQAINALKDAAKLFPTSGNIDFNIANIYYALDDMKNALTFYVGAIEKMGDLDKSKIFPTLRIIAYIYLELDQPENALKYVEQAEKLEEAAKDPGLARMKEAILGSIQEKKDKAAEEAAKKNPPPKTL